MSSPAIEVSADAEIANLPEGWVQTVVGEICEINPAKPASDALPADAPVTFVPMPAVDAVEGAITAPQERPFSEVRKGFTAFRNNDVIMAKITPCMENGKAAIARGLTNGLGFGSTEFHVLRPTMAVLPEYLYSFIRQESYRRAAESEMTGSVGQKRVPEAFLTRTELSLPPLAEQVRIVERLATIWIEGRASRERLSKVRSILKRLRQALLSAACSGRLTEDWRDKNQSPQTGDQLFRKVVGHAPTTIPPELIPFDGLPKGWAWATVADLSSLVTDGDHNPPRRAATGVPHLTAKNIKKWRINFEGCTFITQADFERTRSRYEPREGDLIVTCVGTIGETALVPKNCTFSADRNLAAIRLKNDALLPTVAQYVLNARPWIDTVREGSSSTAQPHLYLKTIRALVVPLIPLDEQQEILVRVRALLDLADRIEQHVFSASSCADRLLQSIIRKAFRGELVLTEAELARREGRDYEPASVLLDRITRERDVQASTKPRRKTPRQIASVASRK